MRKSIVETLGEKKEVRVLHLTKGAAWPESLWSSLDRVLNQNQWDAPQ